MPALKSDNPTNAMINKNFIIQVIVPEEKETKLTTANKIINYIKDEEIKIKLFKEIMSGGRQKYTFKIRNRLTINIWSK